MSVDVRVKAEETRLVILLPQPMSECIIPWQQALEFSRVLKDVAEHIPNPPMVVSPAQIDQEQAQVELGNYRDQGVILLFQHTQRLYFSKESALMVSLAIKNVAQGIALVMREGIRLIQDKHGKLKAVHDQKTNTNKLL